MNAISNDITLSMQQGSLTYDSTDLTVVHEKVYKQFNIVYVELLVTLKNATANAWNTVGSIPSAFAPDTHVSASPFVIFAGRDSTNDDSAEWRIYGDGSVKVYALHSGSINVTLAVSYVTTN